MTWIFLRSQTCCIITTKNLEEVGFDDFTEHKRDAFKADFLGKLNCKLSTVDVIVQLTVIYSALTSI